MEGTQARSKPAHRRPIALSWAKSPYGPSLRETGIRIVRRVPWGTHLCLFCETEQDLIGSALTYFEPAPAGNEYCLWIASEPLRKSQAVNAVRFVPSLERWRKSGAFEIRKEPPGYLGRGEFDLERVIGEFHARIAAARAKGFAGARICIVPKWRKLRLWPDINAYEKMLDAALSRQAAVVLCTYEMTKSWPDDVLDVAHTHQCVMARRKGKWEFLRTDSSEEVKREIDALNHDLDRLPRWLETEATLTERERVVLAQILKGESSKEAARTLGISPRTVEYHRARAMQKLGAKNTAELVRVTLRGY